MESFERQDLYDDTLIRVPSRVIDELYTESYSPHTDALADGWKAYVGMDSTINYKIKKATYSNQEHLEKRLPFIYKNKGYTDYSYTYFPDPSDPKGELLKTFKELRVTEGSVDTFVSALEGVGGYAPKKSYRYIPTEDITIYGKSI